MIPITPVSLVLFVVCVGGGLWMSGSGDSRDATIRFGLIMPLFLAFGLYGLIKLGPEYFRNLPETLSKGLKLRIGISDKDRDL